VALASSFYPDERRQQVDNANAAHLPPAPADVPEIGDLAVAAGLEDDVGELLGVGQPAEGAQRVLEVLAGGDRRLADLPVRMPGID
jgi:hypothetical protein